MTSKMSDKLTMPYDALIRAISVNKNIPHALFLGAGASISSGVPSAATCIWQWKHKIFVSNNPKLSSQVQDFTLPGTQDKIQSWFDNQGKYPQRNDLDEYGFFIEECYQIADDRRKYFQNLVEHAKPHYGYQLLALLAQSELIKSVWTCNFDSLTQKAATLNGDVTCIDITLDSVHRIKRPLARGELLHIALHGDYRYDLLKNTSQEIQAQDVALRDAFIDHCRNTSLIVCGYSGRDRSIVDSFLTAFTQPGTGRLYWCGRDSSEPEGNVKELIVKAKESGREAFYITIEGFDQLMRHLALDCLTGEILDKATKKILLIDEIDNFERKPFVIREGHLAGVIKSNTFPIDCPSEALQFDAKCFSAKGAWALLKSTIENKNIVAVLLKGKVVCLGNADDIRDAFGDKISGTVDRVPISSAEIGQDKGVEALAAHHLFNVAEE